MAIACWGGDLMPLRCPSTPTHGLQNGASARPSTTAITPGMLIAAQDLVANHPGASRERIREHLSGNYCRCTGYQAIVDAIEDVLAARRSKI